MNWTTFDGKEVSLQQIPHSHLSNIIWFSKIFGHEINQKAINELYRRFKGKLLPYQPCPKFVAEWKALERRGMIIDTYYGAKVIVFENTPIGILWDEVKDVSSILKFEPRKLVGFTRLDFIPDGTKVMPMISRNLDMYGEGGAYEHLEKDKEYEVTNCIQNSYQRHGGQSWIKLKGYKFYHPVQKFARWVKPEKIKWGGKISLGDFESFRDMTFEEMEKYLDQDQTERERLNDPY